MSTTTLTDLILLAPSFPRLVGVALLRLYLGYRSTKNWSRSPVPIRPCPYAGASAN